MQRKTSTSKSARTAADRNDAISLLKADHSKVDGLFREFDKAKQADDARQKLALARQICLELSIHATVEEEIFYPEVRQGIDDRDLMNEAKVEHQSLEELIREIQSMDAGDDLFDAKVKVLGEYVKHHVKEEQDEMFPLAKKAGLDLLALGEQIAQRKQDLVEELGPLKGAQDTDDSVEVSQSRSSRRAA